MFIKNSEQVPATIDCDTCDGVDVPSSSGYAHVAQGATGRYCEVLWLCNKCGDAILELPIDVIEARKQCDADPRGYADF